MTNIELHGFKHFPNSINSRSIIKALRENLKPEFQGKIVITLYDSTCRDLRLMVEFPFIRILSTRMVEISAIVLALKPLEFRMETLKIDACICDFENN